MPAFDICSQSGSVESWLAEQPEDPEDYEPSLGSDRKRLSRHQHIASTKRCCLRETEPNSVSMDPPKKHQRASPVKKKKRDVGILRSPFPVRPRTRQRPDEAVFEDNDQENDQTPRPKTLSLKSLPKLDAREVDAEESSSHDRSTSNAETTSTNRKRSASPRKARQRLMLADVGVIPVTIGSEGFELPKDVQILGHDLRRLQTQRGLLPLSIRNDARGVLEFDDEMYYSEQPEPAETLHGLNHKEVWKTVLFIRDAAQESFDEDSPESSWNMTVHAPILQTALRGHWKSQEVWYKDLTTARVYDKDLLPKVQGTSVKSKMVDFGIVIQPRRRSTLWKEIVEVCKSQAYHTINQTDAPHLCRTPVAISMEVKRAGGSEDEALVQLETWVTAHYNNLKVLLGSSGQEADLPILPLVQTQGHEWRLIIAEMKSEENLIILHRGIKLGSTDNILGIYQIIASIDRLAQWVSGDYRTWWTRTVLGYDETK
ncbi:MAG: hypothetical protein Q9199_000577 [Rusavskia elegans]